METVEILGVRVSCLDKHGILDQAVDWASRRETRTITYVNAHCINIATKDCEYRNLLNQMDLVYPDGIGIVWASKFLHQKKLTKVTGREWMDDFCRMIRDRSLSLYILAGAPGIAHKARANIMQRYPATCITGSSDGYFIEKSEVEVLRNIETASPDVLMVGMGVPRQEKWIINHRAEISAPVVWAVGALFDLVSGDRQPVPDGLNRLNLEWLWRLMVDPRGKWQRYLIGNPMFIVRVIRQKYTR